MSTRILTASLACLPVTVASIASAQTVSYELIPSALSANDMSPDGKWIVGDSTAGLYLLDTSSGVMTILPAPGLDAIAVSDNGRSVLGNIPDPEGIGSNVAAIWSEESGWQSLGHLPNAGACPSRSDGYELSADGTVAVGLSWDGCNGRGFRWTAATGMVELEPLANGNNRASVVSADGNVIGGFAQGSFSRTPAKWDGLGAGMLLDPPNGDVVGEVHGISDDGTVLLGEWDGDAIRWTSGGGVEVIGGGHLLPGWTGIAMDLAANDTVVGFDFLQGARRAWIQPGGTGMLQELKSWAIAHGATIPQTQTLQVAQAISLDGRKVIGHGFMTGAWLITIEPDCPADTNGDGFVNVTDLVNVILDWGTDGAANGGDVNGDGTVNVTDLVDVILEWGVC